MTEPLDRHIYSHVMFQTDTVRFYLEGVKFYERLLQGDIDALQADEDLKLILDDETVKTLPLHQEQRRVKDARSWMEEALSKTRVGDWDLTLSVSHGAVRFIKSTSQLYLQQLKHRRNLVAARPNISRHALEALDSRISQLEEKANLGVFSGATPLVLLAPGAASDDGAVPSVPPELLDVVRPRPVIVGSIEVLDIELRTRCLDLFEAFKAEGTNDRLDTVLAEATRILENRIRVVTKLPAESTGVELAKAAFSGQPPLLRVSSVSAEQEAAHLLYRGVFGFIRNNVHHKLVGELLPERVLQIIGFVDYLLFLVDGAVRAADGARSDTDVRRTADA